MEESTASALPRPLSGSSAKLVSTVQSPSKVLLLLSDDDELS